MEPKSGSLIRLIFMVGGIILGIFILLAANLGQAAPMNTFTVNSVFDTDDGSCNGVHCSLREAINAANNAAGADTIDFTLSPNATIVLAGTQLPTITDTLMIDGSTAVSLTISGTNFSRIFQIDSGALVTLTTLIIADGRSEYPDSIGALYNVGGTLIISNSVFLENFAYLDGGAIYNQGGNVTINNSSFSANRAAEGDGGVIYNDAGTITINNSTFTDNLSESGGVIFNDGTIIINDSTFRDNSADSAGGGIYNNGGTIIINNSTFSENNPNDGGGIYNSGGILTANNSTFSGNNAHDSGGGIYNDGGTLTVTKSTFNNNSASDGFGGAIYNNGTLNIGNSTFSANLTSDSFFGGLGGGIANFDSGILNISSSTFSDNSSDLTAGGIFNEGTLNFENTIIGNSIRGDCVNWGTIGTNLNNLVEDGSCSPLLSGDPLLGALNDNGGPTWTHALTLLSPAIDAGDDPACAAPPVNNLDQRGDVRPIDGDGNGIPRCDIGAYEYPLLDVSSYLPLILRN